MLIKSMIFKDMYEVRNHGGWMVGCGSTEHKALQDASYYTDTDITEWESPNMKNLLPTWELIVND